MVPNVFPKTGREKWTCQLLFSQFKLNLKWNSGKKDCETKGMSCKRVNEVVRIKFDKSCYKIYIYETEGKKKVMEFDN